MILCLSSQPYKALNNFLMLNCLLLECIRSFLLQMDFYANKLSFPIGIAKTEALKENLFATIACTVTKTPLIIVGAPGSSKTLSFNLAISNLKGPESKQ